jgi:hypothetical protein
MTSSADLAPYPRPAVTVRDAGRGTAMRRPDAAKVSILVPR